MKTLYIISQKSLFSETMSDEEEFMVDFSLICPECGVGNPKNAKNCMVCDKDLSGTVLFLKDDFFDLEITKELIIEYRKKFWGTDRTGKVIEYPLNEITNLEFGSEITRFKFDYNGERHVLPLRRENMKSLRKILDSDGQEQL